MTDFGIETIRLRIAKGDHLDTEITRTATIASPLVGSNTMINLSLGLLSSTVLYSRGGFSPASLFASNEVGGWYDPSDLSTLFQDAAGTTPVTAVEQPVGLVLDKRSISYSVYFDGTGDFIEMPNSAAFDVGGSDFTIECWIYNGTTGENRHIFGKGDASAVSLTWYFLKNTSNKLVFTLSDTSGSGYSATSSASLPLNAWTHVAFVRNGNTGTLYVNGTADGTVNLTGVTARTTTSKPTIGRAGEYSLDTWSGYIFNLRMVVGTAVYTSNFTVPTSPLTAITNTVLLSCGTSWSGNPTLTRGGDARVDKLNPFNTIPGNHLSQSTSTARPVLSARVNLLTRTEEFSNAVWQTAGSVTKGTTTGTRPNGTSGTIDTVTFGSLSSGTAFIYQDTGQTGLNSAVKFAVYARVASGTATVYLNIEDIAAAPSGGNFIAGSAITLTSEWQLVSLTGTRTAATGNAVAAIGFDTRAAAGQTNASSLTIQVWGADLRPANAGVGLPAYQRVGASTDYDATGFPYYLKFDGTDDSLSSGSIDFTSTDKMSVFAGVRKLADPAFSVIAELGPDVYSNNGSFVVSTRNNASELGYGTLLRGNANTGYWPSTYTAPHSAVLSCVFDIGGAARVDEVVSRVNAATPSSLPVWETANAGTGNFGTYPLNIGTRSSNGSFRFNGHLYSLIVRGAATDAATIASTETWVNQRTKAY